MIVWEIFRIFIGAFYGILLTLVFADILPAMPLKAAVAVAVAVVAAVLFWIRRSAIESGSRLILVLHLCLVGLVYAAVVAAAYNIGALEKVLHQALSLYDPNSGNEIIKDLTISWDEVQRDHSCCGVVSHKDWVKHSTAFGSSHGIYVPDSCCFGLGEEDFEICRRHPSLNQFSDRMEGCFVVLQKLFSDNKEFVAITGAIIFLCYIYLHVGILLNLAPPRPVAG